MGKETILYILGIMIFYNLHLHIIETMCDSYENAKKLKYYWPPVKVFGKESRRLYNSFWTIYWGIAFVLLLLYILIH